ncbi:MAG: hypothetical protein HY911_13570 [Desulfobacterales bacterium]|nr:hypothetical protein [Desulfobacterales bacterium]
MRRTDLRMALILMVLAAFGVFGCSSSSGPLDEVGQRYTTSLSIEDNGEETLDIDVLRDMCDNETEPFTNVFAILTIAVDASAPGLTLQSYTIQYTPLASPDGSGDVVIPPDLVSPQTGYANFDVAPGGSGELEVTCMSIDTKSEYVNNWPPGLDIALYRIRITFHFENTVGEGIDVTIDRTVYLGNYDNC